MAEIKKALSSRRGYHTHHKLLQNVDELVGSEQLLTEGDTISLQDMHEQLQHTEDVISAVDATIFESLNNEKEFEAKVLQAENITSLIATAKAKITHRLQPPDASSTPSSWCAGLGGSGDTATCLPKLNLPHLSGNPSTGNSSGINTSSTSVQKLSYFCAQLRGEASQVIAEFQLTNANYADSVRLLREGFGEPYVMVVTWPWGICLICMPEARPQGFGHTY